MKTKSNNGSNGNLKLASADDVVRQKVKPQPKLVIAPGSLDYALSFIPAGRKLAMNSVLEFTFTEDHPRYKEYSELWKTYNNTPQRGLKPLEFFCKAAKIKPEDFLGDVVALAHKHGQNTAKLVASTMLPKVVQRAYKEGAKASGIDDRHKLLQNEGFMPTPKGTSININQQQMNVEGSGLSSFEDMTKEIAETMSDTDAIDGDFEPLQLESGNTEFLGADVEIAEKELVER